MVIDVGDKSSYIATSIWADNKLLNRVVAEEKTHDTVSRVVLAATHVVNFSSIFSDYCHVFDVPISLKNKPAAHRNNLNVGCLVAHQLPIEQQIQYNSQKMTGSAIAKNLKKIRGMIEV